MVSCKDSEVRYIAEQVLDAKHAAVRAADKLADRLIKGWVDECMHLSNSLTPEEFDVEMEREGRMLTGYDSGILVNLIDTSGEGSFNEVLLKRLNEMAARKTWFSFPFAVEVIKSPDYTGYYRLQRVRP